MARFLLFIRDEGREDVVDFHPDRPSARNALVSYVRQQDRGADEPHPINDDVAINTYFAREGTMYAIARVEKTPGRPQK